MLHGKEDLSLCKMPHRGDSMREKTALLLQMLLSSPSNRCTVVSARKKSFALSPILSFQASPSRIRVFSEMLLKKTEENSPS